MVALVGLWPVDRAWSYPLLFGVNMEGEPESGISSSYGDFLIYNRSSENDFFDSTYNGYTNSDFTGYYIGTISGNTDGQNDPFETIIGYYLGFVPILTQLKVDYEDFEGEEEGSSTENGITLTVTWDEFKDINEPISGAWSLNNAYGFGMYAVKGGDEFALYFVDPAKSSGDWTTRHLLVGNGNVPALSHFSGAPTPVYAPEPTTLLLLGSGLLGLGFIGRRRSGK
jgi:hypothetical protein